MIAKIGDKQRRDTIINHNLHRPFLFVTFDESKHPIVILNGVTQVMWKNFKSKLDRLDDVLSHSVEDKAKSLEEVKVL